jgi:type IV pilus assembly protein PilV
MENPVHELTRGERKGAVMYSRNRHPENGFSLIELTVATAIFSLGLSGLSILMLTAVKGTADARHQTVATAQALSMAEMIMMNSDAVGHYIDPAPADPGACLEVLCSDAAMAAGNWSSWQEQLQHELPDGKGLVCRDSTPDDGNLEDPRCDGDGGLVIKIFWSEPALKPDEGDGLQRMVSRFSW